MKAHYRARPYGDVRLVDGLDRPDEAQAVVPDGWVRCGCGTPVKRKYRSIVYVVKHRTPQGGWCGQRRVVDEAQRLLPGELPPVLWRGETPTLRQGGEAYRPKATGMCHGEACGMRVTGERLYCGPCMVDRNGTR